MSRESSSSAPCAPPSAAPLWQPQRMSPPNSSATVVRESLARASMRNKTWAGVVFDRGKHRAQGHGTSRALLPSTAAAQGTAAFNV